MRPCRHTVRCHAYPQANQGQHAYPQANQGQHALMPLGWLCARVGCAHHLLHTPLQEGSQPCLVILLQIQLLLEDHLQKGRHGAVCCHLQKGRHSALGCHLQKGRHSALCCSFRTTRKRAGTFVIQPGEQGNGVYASKCPLAAVRLLLVDHLQGARHELLCGELQEQRPGYSVSSIW